MEVEPHDVAKESFEIKDSTRSEDVEPRTGWHRAEENSPIRKFTPIEGDANLEPQVGMDFESPEAAYHFYNKYASCVGFRTTKRTSRRSKTNRKLIAVTYVCSRYGFGKVNDSTDNPRPNTKVDCKATMKLKKNESNRWIAVAVIKEHTHELDPKNTRLFHSHEQIQTPKRNSIRNNRTLGTRTNKSIPMLSKQTGDISNIAYVGVLGDDPESKTRRFNNLYRQAIKFAVEGSLSEESYNVALSVLQEGLVRVLEKNNSATQPQQHKPLTSNSHCLVSEDSQADDTVDTPVVHDPQPSKTKCMSSKRIKSGDEKCTSNKQRTCGYCKKAGHNIATCKEAQSGPQVLTRTHETMQQEGQLVQEVPSLAYQNYFLT